MAPETMLARAIHLRLDALWWLESCA